MTEAFEVEQAPGVRVDQLEPGDHVIMFGQAVRIVAAESSAAGIRRVVLRTRSGQGDVDAILSDGWLLVAVDCPRVVTLPCVLCGLVVSAVINLARPGRRSAALCSSCQALATVTPIDARTEESAGPDGACPAVDRVGELLTFDESELVGFDGTLRDGSDPVRWMSWPSTSEPH